MTARSSAPLIRLALIAAVAGIFGAPAPAAQNPQPSFRNQVNAVLVDARVTLPNGEFVDWLTRDDFEVFEDGRRQDISLFNLVDLPLVGQPPPVFAGRRVEHDTASNDAANEGRLYLFVIDDTQGGVPSFDEPLIKWVVGDFVNHYVTEADHVAFVTTSGRKEMAQEFTTNRQRVMAAVDRLVANYGESFESSASSYMPQRPGQADEQKGPPTWAAGTRASLGPQGGHNLMVTLKAVSEWLSGVRGRRKTIVVISNRSSCVPRRTLFDTTPSAVQAELKAHSRALLAAAAQGTATIYLLTPPSNPNFHWDPNLAGTSEPSGLASPRFLETAWDVERGRPMSCEEGLQGVARDSGGFALPLESPDALKRIVHESSSYYLLGYTSTNSKRDGTFRHVEVRTRAAGLKVVARSGYAASDPRTRKLADWSGVSRSLTDLINSPVPTPGLTLDVAAPLFRQSGSKAAVSVILEARASQLQFTQAGDRARGGFAVFMVAADQDGHAKAREFGTLSMRLTSDMHESVTTYGARLLTKLELKPGRYQLRVGALEGARTTRGGVYYDLDVPDFSKGPLSMSHVALMSDRAARAPTAVHDDRWKKLGGAPPTSQREFSRDDTLSSYVEVYDNSKKRGQIIVVSTLRDEYGRNFLTAEQKRDAVTDKNPVYRIVTPLSLQSLTPGQYLLTTEAWSDAVVGSTVIREVPFSIR